MRGLFVTGTGTEVGKTVVSSVIAYSARAAGDRVARPVAPLDFESGAIAISLVLG